MSTVPPNLNKDKIKNRTAAIRKVVPGSGAKKLDFLFFDSMMVKLFIKIRYSYIHMCILFTPEITCLNGLFTLENADW